MTKFKIIIFLTIAAIIAFYAFVYILAVFLLLIVVVLLRILWLKIKIYIYGNDISYSNKKKQDPESTIIDVEYEIVEEIQEDDNDNIKK